MENFISKWMHGSGVLKKESMDDYYFESLTDFSFDFMFI